MANTVDQKSADGLDESEQIWLDQEWANLRTTLVQHVIPELAQIAVTLTPAQLEHAKKEFKERNKKWEDLIELTDEKLRAKRASKLKDSIEDWYGDLTDKQAEDLCKIFACDRADLQRLIGNTNAFQDALIDMIATERDPKIWSEKAILWAAKPESVLVEPQKSSWLAFRKEQPRKLAEVDAMMTKKQRDHAREKLRGMVDDLIWFKDR